MGIFSSIGSLFGPVGMVVGGLADTTFAKKEQEKQNAAAEAAYQRQLEAERLEAEKNRALAQSDAANKFIDMSAAAQKAGINPLTALRTTGAAGFGAYGGFASQAVAPVLSSFSFARTFATNVAETYFDQKVNEPIDKYNKQIRDLEIQQRLADLRLTKGQIGVMSSQQALQQLSGTNPMSAERTAIEAFGYSNQPADMSDAEVAETRYGDIAQEAYGLSVLVADVASALGQSITTTVLPKLADDNIGGYRKLAERLKNRPTGFVPTEYPKMAEQWWMYAP